MPGFVRVIFFIFLSCRGFCFVIVSSPMQLGWWSSTWSCTEWGWLHGGAWMCHLLPSLQPQLPLLALLSGLVFCFLVFLPCPPPSMFLRCPLIQDTAAQDTATGGLALQVSTSACSSSGFAWRGLGTEHHGTWGSWGGGTISGMDLGSWGCFVLKTKKPQQTAPDQTIQTPQPLIKAWFTGTSPSVILAVLSLVVLFCGCFLWEFSAAVAWHVPTCLS